MLRPRHYRALHVRNRFNCDLDKLMKNAESNAKILLESGEPMFLNTVDRWSALKILYEQILPASDEPDIVVICSQRSLQPKLWKYLSRNYVRGGGELSPCRNECRIAI